MKKSIYLLVVAAALIATACKKNGNSVTCDLPSTPVPADMTGKWVSGYNSFTQLIDTYNGRYLGNAWQSGKYFSFSPDGKSAEFYYMANSGLSSSTATKVIGTVTFDEEEGTFTFHGCQGHYKGWQNGSLTLDRAATRDEVETYLTQKYYYSFEESGGNIWMQIRFEPGGTPSSFRSVE